MVEQPVGELRHSEDVDQIEEELQGCDRLLATVPGSQHTRVIVDVHHHSTLLRIPFPHQRLYSRTGGWCS